MLCNQYKNTFEFVAKNHEILSNNKIINSIVLLQVLSFQKYKLDADLKIYFSSRKNRKLKDFCDCGRTTDLSNRMIYFIDAIQSCKCKLNKSYFGKELVTSVLVFYNRCHTIMLPNTILTQRTIFEKLELKERGTLHLIVKDIGSAIIMQIPLCFHDFLLPII